jgi:Ca2+-binding EF-hand superfamily protein
MKKLLIGLAIAVVLIAVIVAAVFYLTSGVTRAGDRFFTLIREGKAKDAYHSTAQEFRAATSEDQFLAFLKTSSIADYDSSVWSSRSISINVGQLEGSLKLRGGGIIPIKVKLVKEGGEWKILAIEKSAAGLLADTGSPALPADSELITMSNNALLLLGRAINAKDFSGFYSASAKIWQGQTTPEALKAAFKSFIDQNLNLTVIEGKIPEFVEKPLIDGSGRLILKGSYPVQHAKINFTLKFIQENREWKLFGVNVSTEEAPPVAARGVMPPESELTEMAHRSVSLLANALMKDDFSEFYKSISKRWQAQTSRDDLRKAFSVFIEKKIPLTVVEGKKPEFTETPKFDNDGVLILEGRYLTEPFRVLFRLEFLNEEAQWRLQAINVETKEI